MTNDHTKTFVGDTVRCSCGHSFSARDDGALEALAAIVEILRIEAADLLGDGKGETEEQVFMNGEAFGRAAAATLLEAALTASQPAPAEPRCRVQVDYVKGQPTYCVKPIGHGGSHEDATTEVPAEPVCECGHQKGRHLPATPGAPGGVAVCLDCSLLRIGAPDHEFRSDTQESEEAG